jgi:hypothetical protein
MRALRLTAIVAVAIAVGGGAVACSRTVSGTGTLAADAPTTTAGPTGSPTGTADPSPTETSSSPTPSPTASPTPVSVDEARKPRRLKLCVLERGAITSTNSNFNKAKTRDGQISALRNGSRTITTSLRGSKLPTNDRVYVYGKAVLDYLNTLIRGADAGGAPSTAPYNQATTRFQKVCSQIS